MPHRGFRGRWISISVRPPWAHNTLKYQISAKSDYLRLSYFKAAPNETMLLRGEWAELHQIWPTHFNTICQCAAKVLMMQSILTARFAWEVNFVPPISQSLGERRRGLPNLERRQVGQSQAPFIFHTCCFVSRPECFKQEIDQISHFSPSPVKLGDVYVGQMSESTFQTQPISQSLIILLARERCASWEI